MIKAVLKALIQWEDQTDVVANTMNAAIHILCGAGSEEDKDTLLMLLMHGTVIDNDKTNPEGVANCSLLWALSAVYLNFEERLKRIVNYLVAEAD